MGRPLVLEEDKVKSLIAQLLIAIGEEPNSFKSEMVAQQIETSLRMLIEGHEVWQIKLITRAIKEMRYAYHIFNQYPVGRRISIFGSARTPEDHPDYHAAKEFSYLLAKHHWSCITGAAHGIMKAGLEGHKPEHSFGLSIRLPFETPAPAFFDGNAKLINFRYFFTRKLIFMSHSDAVGIFPGGFGTFDEMFEILTLMQTGRSQIIPVVLMEGTSRNYWIDWQQYVRDNLLKNGWISPDDEYFYHIASSVTAGVEHILHFYKRYHSYRYVRDLLVIRLLSPLTQEQVDVLNEQFKGLVSTGKMEMALSPLPEEEDHPELPRLIFHHTRNDFGLLRRLIDAINDI